MKGWLCMQPEMMTVLGAIPVQLPTDVLAMLAVYRTKKAARSVHGKNAVLVQVEVPIEEPKHGN